MVGYSTYKGIGIRHRSSTFDVPLGSVPYDAFVNFATMDEAKAFIDSGRIATGYVVYSMETQAPVAA
jgi:hypothetical protein